MEMRQYLLDTFGYNDYANKLVLAKTRLLPDPAEAVKLFSHVINSQRKWLARVLQDPQAPQMDWWTPAHPLAELEERWNRSLKQWLDFVGGKTEDELFGIVQFTGYDGGRWEAALKDIALQLNYHSIHHRAQIQTIIRRQGLEPDFVDYIGTKYKKL